MPRRAEFDLTRWDDAERLFAEARPEIVFHLAAEVGGIGANRANPGRYWYANLIMGAHVLELSRLHGVRKLVVAGHGLRLPEVHAHAVPRGRALERLPGGDERAVRRREEVGARRRAGLPRAVRPRHRLPAAGEPLRAAGQLRPRDLARRAGADPQDGRRTPSRSCSGATARRRASSSTSRTPPTRSSLAAERYSGAGAAQHRHRRRDLDPRARGHDRRADRLRGRDRLGRVDAERPAAAAARHEPRRGRARLATRAPRCATASSARSRGTGRRRSPMPTDSAAVAPPSRLGQGRLPRRARARLGRRPHRPHPALGGAAAARGRGLAGRGRRREQGRPHRLALPPRRRRALDVHDRVAARPRADPGRAGGLPLLAAARAGRGRRGPEPALGRAGGDRPQRRAAGHDRPLHDLRAREGDRRPPLRVPRHGGVGRGAADRDPVLPARLPPPLLRLPASGRPRPDDGDRVPGDGGRDASRPTSPSARSRPARSSTA